MNDDNYEQLCPICSHQIMTKGYCDYCAMPLNINHEDHDASVTSLKSQQD